MAPKPGWRTSKCVNCRGYGVVSSYTFDGSDFLGAKECRNCGGSGVVYISPQGRIADYPGGCFRGFASESEIAASQSLHGR